MAVDAVGMMRTLSAITAFVLMTGLATSCVASANSPCRAERVDGVDYTICGFDPADDIRLFRADAAGEVYGDFDNLESDLAAQGETLRFAMNAGMYHADRAPVGLFIEDGVDVSPLVTSKGPGNFHMLPNGVLVLSRSEDKGPLRDAYVIESGAYEVAAHDVWSATQSGPMLVIDGALHPKFLASGTSRKIRNGVGVGRDGLVYFVKSETPVNFHGFARLFRDHLGADDALYLDGTVSRVFIAGERNDAGVPMGPMVGVVE